MEAKRSQLRFKITVSLALAGLTASGGVLLYRADRAGAGAGAGATAARRRAQPIRGAGAAVPGRATARRGSAVAAAERHQRRTLGRVDAGGRGAGGRGDDRAHDDHGPRDGAGDPGRADRAARAPRPAARHAQSRAAGPAATVKPASVNRAPATPPRPPQRNPRSRPPASTAAAAPRRRPRSRAWCSCRPTATPAASS